MKALVRAEAESLGKRAQRGLRPYLRRLPAPVEGRIVRGLTQIGIATRSYAGPATPPVPSGTGTPLSAEDCPDRRPPIRHRAAVILMYHRISSEAEDPFRLAVSPERFAEQMEIVRRYAEPVPLRDLTRPGRGPRIAVTFDDGYADNAGVALGTLAQASVPATVFVTSALVGSTKAAWSLRLEELFRAGRPATDQVMLNLGGHPMTFETPRRSERLAAMWAAHDTLRPHHPSVIARAMSDLERHFGAVDPDPGRRMLTRGELVALADNALITIGAHTRRHPWLSSLPPALQEEEIEGSRRDLEEITGRSVDEFAYPYGGRLSFDARSVRAVRRAGFALACTTFNDPLVRGTSPFLLPRRQVLDWDRSRFARHLQLWLTA